MGHIGSWYMGLYRAKTVLIKQTIKARIVQPNKQPSSALKYSFFTNISFQSSKLKINFCSKSMVDEQQFYLPEAMDRGFIISSTNKMER